MADQAHEKAFEGGEVFGCGGVVVDVEEDYLFFLF